MSRWPHKDYLQGTSTISFCEKWHPPEKLFYKPKSGCRFGEKCSCGHRQLDEQPSKRYKKNGDKSAVATLKKMSSLKEQRDLFWMMTHQVHDNWVAYSRKKSHRSLHRFAEELRHTETIPMCKNHRSRCTSHWHSRPKSFVRRDFPKWTSAAQTQRSKNWGSVSRRDGVARARCTRSSVEAGQKCV